MKKYFKDKLLTFKKVFWDNYIGYTLTAIICLAAFIYVNYFLIDWNAFIYHGRQVLRLVEGSFRYRFLNIFETFNYILSFIFIVFNVIVLVFKINKVWSKVITYFSLILSLYLTHLMILIAFGYGNTLSSFLLHHLDKIAFIILLIVLVVFFISKCTFKNKITATISTIVILSLCVLPILPKRAFDFRSHPIVFDGGDSYVIAWATTSQGMSWVEATINDETQLFYDIENAMASVNKVFHAIRIPKIIDDSPVESFSYTINSKKLIWRSAAFYKFGKEISSDIYNFSTIPMDSEQVTVGAFNDVHGEFKTAAPLRDFIGECDIYLVLGDMLTATFTVEEALKNVDFTGNLSRGEKLVYPVRGNHETRGTYYHLWAEYMITPSGEQYYHVDYHGLNIIMLDTGDDHPDSAPINGGVSFYEEHTAIQVEWLKSLQIDNPKWLIASSHINFSVGNRPNNIISFTPILQDMGVKLLIHGHNHRIGRRNLIIPADPNAFPAFVPGGYRNDTKEFGASRVVFQENRITMTQYDNKGEIRFNDYIDIN